MKCCLSSAPHSTYCHDMEADVACLLPESQVIMSPLKVEAFVMNINIIQEGEGRGLFCNSCLNKISVTVTVTVTVTV
jgi:hypothetical protein